MEGYTSPTARGLCYYYDDDEEEEKCVLAVSKKANDVFQKKWKEEKKRTFRVDFQVSGGKFESVHVV